MILFKENHCKVGFGSNELVKYVVGNLNKSTINTAEYRLQTADKPTDLLDISSSQQIVDPGENLPRFLQFSVVNTGDLILEKLQGWKLINIVLGSQGFVLMIFIII